MTEKCINSKPFVGQSPGLEDRLAGYFFQFTGIAEVIFLGRTRRGLLVGLGNGFRLYSPDYPREEATLCAMSGKGGGR